MVEEELREVEHETQFYVVNMLLYIVRLAGINGIRLVLMKFSVTLNGVQKAGQMLREG